MNDKRHMAKVAFRSPALFALTLLPLFTTGCLYAGGDMRTEFKEAQRIPVKFPSARASHDFHKGLRQSDREAYTDAGGFVMPLLAARGSGLYHETAHYNAEVRLADINRDREITEEEARAYLAYIERDLAGD